MSIVLTGDRPTGELHLGHYVGSLQKRVELQNDPKNELYIVVADLHTLTTHHDTASVHSLKQKIITLVKTYLAVGIDSEKATIFLQSQIPYIGQLNTIFANLVAQNKLMRVPTVREMSKGYNYQHPLGVVAYPVLQTADILVVRGEIVPVGADNLTHIELSRDIANKFNQLYGEVFTLPHPVISLQKALVGTDGKGKMSKSKNNSIDLIDTEKVVRKKVKQIFTDPNRIRADIPGTVEGNPLFEFHDVFNKNKEQVNDFKKRYREGRIGDVEIKNALADILVDIINPIRERYIAISDNEAMDVLAQGTKKAMFIAKKVYDEVLGIMNLPSF